MAGTMKAIHSTISKIYSSTSGGSTNKCKKDAIIKETRSDTHPCQNWCRPNLLQCFLAIVVATLGPVIPFVLFALRLRSVILAVTILLSATSLIPSILCLTGVTPLFLAFSSFWTLALLAPLTTLPSWLPLVPAWLLVPGGQVVQDVLRRHWRDVLARKIWSAIAEWGLRVLQGINGVPVTLLLVSWKGG